MAKLEEQLSRLMQSAPADVSITPKGATPFSPPPPPMHSSPSLAKSGRRRSAFELVRSGPIFHITQCRAAMRTVLPGPLARCVEW